MYATYISAPFFFFKEMACYDNYKSNIWSYFLLTYFLVYRTVGCCFLVLDKHCNVSSCRLYNGGHYTDHNSGIIFSHGPHEVRLQALCLTRGTWHLIRITFWTINKDASRKLGFHLQNSCSLC